MVLEADHRVEIGRQVVLPELHDGERLPACLRINQADRLHRPEQGRIAAAPGHLLDRQAAFEVVDLLLELVCRRFGGAQERLVEPVVFLLGEGTIQVVLAPLAVA